MLQEEEHGALDESMRNGLRRSSVAGEKTTNRSEGENTWRSLMDLDRELDLKDGDNSSYRDLFDSETFSSQIIHNALP